MRIARQTTALRRRMDTFSNPLTKSGLGWVIPFGGHLHLGSLFLSCGEIPRLYRMPTVPTPSVRYSSNESWRFYGIPKSICAPAGVSITVFITGVPFLFGSSLDNPYPADPPLFIQIIIVMTSCKSLVVQNIHGEGAVFGLPSARGYHLFFTLSEICYYNYPAE